MISGAGRVGHRVRRNLFIASLGAAMMLGCPSAFAQQDQAKQRSQTPPSGPQRQERQTKASAMKIKLGLPKTGPRIKNSLAAQRNSATIAVLQKQKQAADLEFAHMKAMRATSKTSAAQSQTASGPATAARAQTVKPGTLNKAGGPPPPLAPGKPLDAPGNSPSSTAHATQIDATAFICAQDPTMRILKVSGESYPGTFTPDPQYNPYTITGCSFGDPNPNNQVYLYGPGGLKAIFADSQHAPLFWSDNSITVDLDPQLAGVNDVPSVTLVVHRADINKEVEKSGFKFYAARKIVQLNPILSGLAKLTDDRYFHPQYTSSEYSALVSRFMHLHHDRPTGNESVDDGTPIPSLPPGTDYRSVGIPFFGSGLDIQGLPGDYFDFSNLAKGFETDSFSYFYWQPDPMSLCGAGDDIAGHTAGTYGNWQFDWSGDRMIRVVPQIAWCWDLEVFVGTYIKQSQYALNVYVSGPRCLDPWTGQPDQPCIQRVKQGLQ